MDCSMPGFPVNHQLLEFAQTHMYWVSDAIQPSHPLSSPSPLSIFPSIFPSIRVFSNESALHIRWPKYWSFSFSISPSNEYSGLIFFRLDWLNLLAVKYKTLRDWCWSWNSNTLATWCEEMTHWKRPWCWERLKVGGEGGDRGWDGWMASPTQWTWVWVDSGSWWWTGKPGMLQSMRSQRVRHNWATELTDGVFPLEIKLSLLYLPCRHLYQHF